MNLGNLQGAATDLERAVELAPEDIAGWFNLGALRPAASAPRDKVASCLDRLVKIAPERALQFLAVPDVERVLLPSNPSDLGEVSFDRSKSPKPDRVPPYPPEARPRRIQGDVGVELILDQDGRPVRVRAVSGSAELRAAAEYCAVQLRYPPDLLGSKGRPVRLVQAIPFKLR
jgi:outer membrane biosynthesis protein TonB